ncbi:KamA family radical SAM protein [Candidatus Magnetaquiglobus chichijimensis]
MYEYYENQESSNQINHQSYTMSPLLGTKNRDSFLSNTYYLSLINWENPDDPIRRLVIPSDEEQEAWGSEDPSNEAEYMPVCGLQHKYPSTALMLISNRCASICRYCFRKRIFQKNHLEKILDYDQVFAYLLQHEEVSNVLLSGGDPLMLPTRKLDRILTRLRAIDHIDLIRIGSKIPAFLPQRILNDDTLLRMLKRHSTSEKRIYLIAHFTHPCELTPEAMACLDRLTANRVVILNQCPLIRGVNDKPETLLQLYRQLAATGVQPYYLFQCRPARGNRHFTVPLETGMQILNQVQAESSGLVKRARYVMSHVTGKIEMVGLTDTHAILKYWRAAKREDSNKIMLFKRNPNACWLEDYQS